MIGDRNLDIRGAAANGVASIGVLWGFGDRAEHEAAGATHIC
jgi:phosphoglycolate phosphatase